MCCKHLSFINLFSAENVKNVLLIKLFKWYFGFCYEKNLNITVKYSAFWKARICDYIYLHQLILFYSKNRDRCASYDYANLLWLCLWHHILIFKWSRSYGDKRTNIIFHQTMWRIRKCSGTIYSDFSEYLFRCFQYFQILFSWKFLKMEQNGFWMGVSTIGVKKPY